MAPWYPGIPWLPWYTMVYHGIPWFTMSNHGVPWFTMVYHGLQAHGEGKVCISPKCPQMNALHQMQVLVTIATEVDHGLHSKHVPRLHQPDSFVLPACWAQSELCL